MGAKDLSANPSVSQLARAWSCNKQEQYCLLAHAQLHTRKEAHIYAPGDARLVRKQRVGPLREPCPAAPRNTDHGYLG